MTVDITVLIAVLGFALSVGTFFIGRVTAAKTSGQEYGVMLTEIGYIKSGVDDMKKNRLKEKTAAVKSETREALQTMYDALNPGQQKQIVKNEAVAILFERYGVVT